MLFRRFTEVACILGWAFCCSFWAVAQDQGSEQLGELSLEALLDFKVSLATKTEQTLAEAPAIVSVITGAELRDFGYRDLEEALRHLAGFDAVRHPLAGNQAFAIRGILSTNNTNNLIKVMLNGHSFQSVGGGPHHYFQYIPMENIKKLEIIRGPGSALYGANAFTGVINIITKEADTASTLSVEGGSFDSNRQVLDAHHQWRDWSFDLIASRTESDGPSRTLEADLVHTSFSPALSAAPGPMNLATESTNIQGTATRGNFRLSTFFSQVDKELGVGISGALTDENLLMIKGSFIDMAYFLPFENGKGDLTFRAYHDYFSFFEELEIFPEQVAAFFSGLYGPAEPFPADTGIIGQPGVRYSLAGTESTLRYSPRDGIQLVGGLLFDDARTYKATHFANANVSGRPLEVNGQVFQPFQYFGGIVDLTNVVHGNWILPSNRRNLAGYAQLALDFKTLISGVSAHTFALTLGLRHDDYSDIGKTTNPRAGLVYAPIPKLYFKALYGEAFRAPTYDELFQVNNPTNIGNPNLKPEQLKTFEFLVGFNLGDHFKSQLSYYHTEVTENIQLVNREYTNTGVVNSRGIEGELKYHADNHTYLFFNFSTPDVQNVSRARTTATDSGGLPVAFTQRDFDVGSNPDLILNLGAYIRWSPLFSTSLTANYAGERARPNDLDFVRDGNGVPVNGDVETRDQRSATESRQLINAQIIWRPHPQWTFYLSGQNILNEDYRDPEFTGTIPVDIPRAKAAYQLKAVWSF